MWLLHAPFDNPQSGEPTAQKTKLLKTGASYPLGRKDRPLVLNSKKISHDHCVFNVGAWTEDDVANPESRPSLSFVNNKSKAITVMRSEVPIPVNPNAEVELQDGDEVTVVGGLTVIVKWTEICIFSALLRGKSSVATSSLKSCASLGIHVTNSALPHPSTTHHICQSYAPSLPHALSLLSACTFVKPEWLAELLKLNNDDDLDYRQPLANKYRPSFAGQGLVEKQKTFATWEANEGRIGMWNGWRFVLLCSSSKSAALTAQIEEAREIITRAGGSVDAFDGEDKDKFRKMLVRAQAKLEGYAVVVSLSGKSNEMSGVAKSFKYKVISTSDLIQSVINVDLTVLKTADEEGDVDMEEPGAAGRSSSPLPDFVPNTHPEEPSYPPPTASVAPRTSSPEPIVEGEKPAPTRRLTRRVTSRQSSQEPQLAVVEENTAEAPKPRRALTRRAHAGTGMPVLTGIDDPSLVINALPDLSTTESMGPPPAPAAADPTTPAPPRSSRLKRRVVGVTQPSSATFSSLLESQLGIDVETGEEPPLKKFKALFDASDPNAKGRTGSGMGQWDLGEESSQTAAGGQSQSQFASGSQTQTQTQTQTGTRKRSGGAPMGLSALREEEEEETSQPAVDASSRTLKRKTRGADEDAEMVGVDEDPTSGRQPDNKKRAIESVNAVQRANSKPPSTSAPLKTVTNGTTQTAGKPKAPGAAPGKPDTDAAFLKALASTKRGKKTEDAFDRDFNKLKISKPNPDQDVDDEREREEQELKVLATFGDEERNVRGNFMNVIEIDVWKGGDKGRENNRRRNEEWEGKPNFKKFKKKGVANARATPVELVVDEINEYGMGPGYWKGGSSQLRSQIDFHTQPVARGKGKSQPVVIESDDEAPRKAKGKGPSKPPARAASRPPSRAGSATRKLAPSKTPLFLDSEDEDIRIEEEDDKIDEDEDEGEHTLQSSADTVRKAQAPTRRSGKAALAKGKKVIVVDDDSDDDAVFKGFKGRSRK